MQPVAGDIGLVEKGDVLDAAIIEDEIVDVVIVDLAGLVDDTVAWIVQIGADKALPFLIGKVDAVEVLQPHAHIGQHGFG